MGQDRKKAGSLLALVSALLLVASDAFGLEGISAGFETALRAVGWDVKRLQDGSVELRPGALVPQAAEPSDASDALAAEGVGSEAESAAWHRLRESGWRVETGADGSTFLYPPVTESGKKAAPAEPRRQGEPKESVTEGLDAQLAARGWRVDRTADGSLLLYPRAVPIPVTRGGEIQPCAGTVPRRVEGSDIVLPVARLDQAKKIAESWLTSVGVQGLRIGRIRRILRVFLVSVVDSNPPHRLMHQIAINAADGRVIVLN